MINDLINPLHAVKMFSAATWSSLAESTRPSFEELLRKLEVMILGLEHWPAGNKLPIIPGLEAVNSDAIYHYGLTIARQAA